jgi:hypothetical protein
LVSVCNANWIRAGQSVPSSLKVKIALLGVFFSVAGCAGPSISRFQITPLALCERETAVAKWDVQGEPTISFSLEPPPKDESHCSAKGRETFTFTLAAEKSGKDAEEQIEVVQVRDGASEPIAFQTSRLEGFEVVASGEKNPSLWTDRVRIESLNACQNRAIQVEHSGKSVFLSADGKPSDALAGTELTGMWELRSPLKPDEQTTPNLRPAQLEILATLRCEEARSVTSARRYRQWFSSLWKTALSTTCLGT